VYGTFAGFCPGGGGGGGVPSHTAINTQKTSTNEYRSIIL